MRSDRPRWALPGTLVFLVLVPGTVGVLVPFWLTGWRPVLLAYAALLWLIFHLFIVLYEEPALASRFGSAYDRYRQHVGRWRPRARPWVAEP